MIKYHLLFLLSNENIKTFKRDNNKPVYHIRVIISYDDTYSFNLSCCQFINVYVSSMRTFLDGL